MRFETVCFLYATSHFAVALTLIAYYRYRYFAAKVTALLILRSVLPHASFSALVLKSENEPHTDEHPLNNLARFVRLQYAKTSLCACFTPFCFDAPLQFTVYTTIQFTPSQFRFNALLKVDFHLLYLVLFSLYYPLFTPFFIDAQFLGTRARHKKGLAVYNSYQN